jgi:ribosomal protein S13
MPLPPLTPEQRAAAMDRAVRGPEVHAEMRRGLQRGTMSMPDVLGRAATDDLIGMMQVSDLLACLPGVGTAGAAYIMEQLGIASSRRVRSLGQNQREALMGELPRVPPSLAAPPGSPPAVPPASVTTDPEMISARDLIVRADYHQICISSRGGEDEDEGGYDHIGHLHGASSDATESGSFVGVRPGFIALLTPGQWNWRTPMRVEIWSAEPPDDRGDWDHEVDADFDVPDGRISFMPSGGSGSAAEAEIPAGRYRVRISGRGFTELGRAGAEGGDSFRLRLWPRGEREDPALRKRWPGWDKYR